MKSSGADGEWEDEGVVVVGIEFSSSVPMFDGPGGLTHTA